MKLEDLRTELKVQLKNRNQAAVDVLRLMIGNLDMEAKLGKIDVIAKIKSEIKKSKEALTFSETDKLKTQIDYLENLLPKQLTADEVSRILEDLNPKHIGEGMGYFKKNHNGLFDGGMVSKMVKDFLK